MRPLIVGLVVAASAVFCRVTHAQTCTGMASFASGPVRIGGAATFNDGGHAYGVELAAGAPSQLFGSASLSRAETEGLADPGFDVGISGGYAVGLNSASSIQFCPVVGLGHTALPDIPTPIGAVSSSVNYVSFGGSLGGRIAASPTLEFVPFVGGNYMRERIATTAVGATTSETDDLVIMSLGAGVVLNKSFTVRPSISLPLRVDGGTASFGIALGYNFGGASAAKQ